MPSWVPDFSEERICYPYSNVLFPEASFKASGDLAQDIELDDEANSLVVKAVTIDQVLDISEAGPLDWGLHDLELADVFKILPILHRFVHAAMDLCEKHPSSSSLPDQRTPERLWWALIIGRIERRPADMKFKKVFQPWLLNLDLMTSSRDRSHYRQRLKEGALDDGPGFTGDGTETTYQYGVAEACFGRRIAITASGRLCVVPPLTRVGDSVIIPYGSQTPFLVRKRHHQSDNTSYELVGEAWVEGVMYGEAIRSADEELIRIS